MKLLEVASSSSKGLSRSLSPKCFRIKTTKNTQKLSHLTERDKWWTTILKCTSVDTQAI